MPGRIEVEVVGVRAAMAQLRQLDRGIFFQSVKEVKAAAEPLAQALAAKYAVSPFAGRSKDGFAHNGRTGWARGGRAEVKYGGRKRADGTYPIASVRFTGAAPEMVDMAGSGNLAEQLGGTPSRNVWPTANTMRPEIDRAIEAAVEAAVARVNSELGR